MEHDIQHNRQGPLIETLGVTKVFNSGKQIITAISDISIKIFAGDFLIIFGSSTSGKTTLLSVLSGMEKPDLGEVLIKNEPFYELSEDERSFIRNKKFGFIPQSKRWVSHLNLLENVALPLIISGEKAAVAKKAALEILGQYGLQDLSQHNPTTLSNVEQQIASIARAVINQPWLILVDEPYVSLTAEAVDKILGLLKKINEETGCTILMSTNNASLLKHSNKWLFMDEGKLEDISSEKNSIKRLKEVIEIVEKQEQELKNKNVFDLSF
ncbi:MAG TPA: ATP-binding cassette domain-containing protein [Candidatus Saccharimonadales bacterium]|nr:ATP-binding cassette domain-containing protein [Candidatus Saccharimonadales bacterium]